MINIKLEQYKLFNCKKSLFKILNTYSLVEDEK